ncbi:MAG: hypothetical protein WCK53_10165 [Methanomicrobiales archaeon]
MKRVCGSTIYLPSVWTNGHPANGARLSGQAFASGGIILLF